MKIKKSHKSFGGETIFASHHSPSTQTEMNFSFFKPQGEIDSALLFLSGLTCSEENFITKSGIQSLLSKTKTMVICPDTSPRGLSIEGSQDSYDFGEAASFYLNAVEKPYSENYQMESYLIDDLLPLIQQQFSVEKVALMGHSMGGHGALTLGLNYPDRFTSLSAFSPITNPSQCAWGKKAFSGYLGENKELWKKYDACELINSGKKHPEAILIDQGLADEFYPEQLLTENFESACRLIGQELICHKHESYDHSYYFISTFLAEHVKHHLKRFS